MDEASIHLTLRFIGETTGIKQEAFADALRRVSVESFVLPVGGVGLFPTRGLARVLWAGVGTGHTRLHQLRKQVDEALLAVEPGLSIPGFRPHFTVARLDGSSDVKEIERFLETHREFEAPPFRVKEFRLMASIPRPGQPPAYETLRVFPLEQ